MKKVLSSRRPACSSKAYLQEVLSIVPTMDLWVAVKTKMQIQEIKVDDHVGYQLEDGTVLTLQDMSWNDMVSLGHAMQEYTSFSPVMDGEEVPNYRTPTEGVKFGYFEDVYKIGYILFPLEARKGFNNKPIILRKIREAR